MSKVQNTQTQDQQLAGLGEQQTPTNQQAIAQTWFCGERPLKLVWIMQPVNQFTRETDQGKGPKNFSQPAETFISGTVDPFAPIDGFTLPGFK